MSYYNVDAILTDAEKVPCETNIDLPDLGYLDNNPTLPLKAGTKIALPLWLAEMLALANTSSASGDGQSFVSLKLPYALSNEVTQALKADPRAVPLRDQSPHFYSLATRLMDLFEERELDEVLRKTYVMRSAEITLHARKAGGDAGSRESIGERGSGNLGISGGGEEFLRGLDEWERRSFRMAHDGAKTSAEWMDGVRAKR